MSQAPARVPVPREIWVLVVAAFVIALGFGIIAPILPQYAASFDVGVAAASAIVTVFALTRMVFAPGAGVLISRFGERWMYIAGLAVVARCAEQMGATYGLQSPSSIFFADCAFSCSICKLWLASAASRASSFCFSCSLSFSFWSTESLQASNSALNCVLVA